MAALMLPSPPVASTVPKSRASKQGRSRPNLSRVCQKTKICSFYLRDACTRGKSCTFAHDEQELQPKPDLSCTKPCPDLLSIGHCTRPDCKYAHNDCEIRQLDIEGAYSPGMQHEQMPKLATTPDNSHNQANSILSLAASPVRQPPRTAPQVVSRLNDAALCGALPMGEMISHLTRIFLSVYEARPDIATRLKIPADVLAFATAENAWADAGIDKTAPLSFHELVRWCALPPDMLLQEVPPEDSQSQPMQTTDNTLPMLKNCKRSTRSGGSCEDSDLWSECSTDEGSSDHSVSRCNSARWPTPESSEDLAEEGWRNPELKVMNTFIHFSPRKCSNRARRAQSVPSRLS